MCFSVLLTRSSVTRLSLTIASLIWFLAIAPASGRGADEQRPPNFIIIFADDLGYADLGCYGAVDLATPEIDKMAAEGLRFTDFYVASPTCTPSRAALLTGCYPLRAGFDDAVAVRADGSRSPSRVLWPNSPLGLNPNEVTIGEVLQDAGYATAAIGKWHLGDQVEFNPTRHGFDEFFGVMYSNDMAPFEYVRNTDRLDEPMDRDQQLQRYTSEAIDFIRRQQDQPFFLYVAHTMPHTPLAVSERFAGTSPRGKYGDVIAELDWSVGEILDVLAELGIDEQTLVVFTSDNGPWLHRGEAGGLATPLRGGKGSTYEGGMRVPCVVRQPGFVPAGKTCQELATTMDLLPTFAKLAGGDAPTDRKLDGHDIGPLLRGEANARSPYDHFYYYFGNELHGVRSGRWKLRVRNHLKNENIYWYAAPKDIYLRPALYDLHTDPGEQKSVMNDHPEVVARLEALLEEARGDLGDSLTSVAPTNTRPTGRVAKVAAPDAQ